MKIPRLLIAGTHSGVGKTTVTAGLIQAFTRQGFKVQPFKAGPDYIDPGYHSEAAGRLCRNLDSWLIPPRRLPELFQRSCRGADLAVIEGVMGLYDGASATGDAGSTAELAKLLDCPVLLVLDASAVSRSAAAVVRGFRDMDRKVRIAGCIVNRLSGLGHYRLVKEGIERLAGVPVVGWLPKDPEIHLPERHLGLVPAIERKGLPPLMKRLERVVAANFDLPAIRRIAEGAPLMSSLRAPKGRSNLRDCFVAGAPRNDSRVPIAVARDEAFHFYYPENLELLEDLGTELVPFSPLKDRRLPRGVAALYLGGGFPEVFAPQLARNRRMKEDIRWAVNAGLPTYAECGGLMYLARSISAADGRRHRMAGLIPADVRMTDRLQNFGYQEVRSKGANLLARAGEKARGHEFHHSILERWAPAVTEAAPSLLPRKCRGAGAPRPVRPAYEIRARRGGAVRLEGYADGSLLASYVHLHFWSQPRWAERFVQSARAFKVMFLAALLLPGVGLRLSWAEESGRMNEVVVTATKAKTPQKQVTRAVSVVSGEGMGEREGRFVTDSLNSVPGTFVRRSGGFGKTTSLVIRGSSDTQVQVTLDGARVGSTTTGNFNFNHLAPDNLERVEILRGPNSVLYGADAMGGVVNLETHRGEGPLSGSYTQEVGSWDTWRESSSVQAGVGPWHLSGGISRLDTQGLSDNDEYQDTNISARVGYDFGPDHTLDVTVRNSLSIVGIDDGAFRPDPNRKDRERQTIGSVRWSSPVTPWWSQSLRFSTDIANLIDNDPSDRSTNANSLFKLDTERYGAEWSNRFTPVEWDAVTLGVEFEDREADNRSFSKTQTTRAVYLENQWNPTPDLTILTGGRLFHESAFGTDNVLDASAAYFFSPLGVKFRGGYGQGFRVPTLNELFFPNFGNPALQAENSETMEAGVEQVIFKDLLEWSTTFFRTNYENLIQFVNVGGTTLPLNVGKARVDGVELETKLGPWNHWSLEGSYTHLIHGSRPSGEELLRVPNNTFGTGLSFAPGKWEARLDGLLVSSREESTSGGRNKQEGYFKLDFYGKYQFKEWLRGFVRVENLTNRNYREILGFDAPGLTATVGVTVEK